MLVRGGAITWRSSRGGETTAHTHTHTHMHGTRAVTQTLTRCLMMQLTTTKLSQTLSLRTKVKIAILTIITLLAVVPLMGRETHRPPSPQTAEHQLVKRSWRHRRPLLWRFTENVDDFVRFDLCSVVNCKAYEFYHRQTESYACIAPDQKYPYRPKCPWEHVIANTGSDDWGYQHENPLKSRLTLVKGVSTYPCKTETCNPLILTLKNPQLSDAGHYIIGIEDPLVDPLGFVVIEVIPRPSSPATGNNKLTPSGIAAKKVSDLTIKETLAIETGFTQENYWLNWVESAAKVTSKEDCIVCSASRPALLTVPSLFSYNETYCMMHLHMTENPEEACKYLETPYPLSSPEALPPIFTSVKNEHTCITRIDTSGSSIGDIPDDWCTNTINVTTWTNVTKLTYARSDVYWYCGGKRLRNTLPNNWSGTCTMVSLIAPIKVIKASASEVASWRSTWYHNSQTSSHSDRRKRAAFDLYQHSPTYIDAIGVPRGVPDEYKLVNQVAAGFESSLFWWVTINKNVDRINYVHFNIQRLNNMTRDAVVGLHGQLSATTLMTYQNRLALDFLLAERGGVCSMFGQDCFVFIPNNTAPDGSITRALSGLKTLSEELAENSGIDNPSPDWLDNVFGKWKTLITSVLLSLVAAVTMLTLCGCCCIPCIRHLCLKCITTAINDKFAASPSYQLVQHTGETIPRVSLSEPGEDETEVDPKTEDEENPCLYT